ncbi:MAG: hypothetical protein ABIT05_12465 [Chitinophagaceae bacterium]
MKKISGWAKDHKWSARIIIILSILTLNVLAIITGQLIRSLGLTIPIPLILLFVCLYAIGFVAYPSKALKGKTLSAAAFYTRQKSCDLLLAGATFFMIVGLATHPDRLFRYGQSLYATSASSSSLPGDSSIKTYKSIPAFIASMKDEKGNTLKWKERKKLLKEQVKAINRSAEPSQGAKTALIILSVIGALLLIYAVAALACSLSCGGSDALAIVVAIGGTALVVWLLIVVIRSITGNKKKKNKEPGKEAAPPIN